MNNSLAEDLMERVAVLERNERNYAHEILSLHRENDDLKKRVKSNERKYTKLKESFDLMGNTGTDTGNASHKTVGQLKQKYDALETAVRNLQGQVKTFGQIQQTIENLDKMIKMLNRAMIQSHQKSLLDSNVDSCEKDGSLRKHVADLQKWKDEKATEDGKLLERIRSVARQTGCIDAIQDQMTMLTLWKDEKEVDDEQKSKRLEDTLTKINSNFSVVKESLKEKPQEASSSITKKMEQQHAQTVDSLFCADLGTHQSLGLRRRGEVPHAVKLNKCTAAYKSQSGPFDSQSGTFKPQHDGAYNLGWKIHQKGDGKIRFVMAIDGMRGRIYLGSTDEPGGICSGTLVAPMKAGQRVWIEAKRVSGPDAEVYGCNFMGWLLELNSLGNLERITTLQDSLFSPIVNECQHI